MLNFEISAHGAKQKMRMSSALVHKSRFCRIGDATAASSACIIETLAARHVQL